MFDPELLRDLGMLPNEYLYYYYHREKALANMIEAGATRGKTIELVNIEMMKKLSQLNIDEDPEEALQIFLRHMEVRENSYMSIETGHKKEAVLSSEALEVPDGIGYAGVMLDCIEGLQSPEPRYLVLSVPNEGCIAGLGPDDVIEVTCRVSNQGIHPVPIGVVPDHCNVMIHTIKLYEKLTIEAIAQQSKTKAIRALMLHPLVNSYSLAKKLVKAYDREYGGIFN